MAQYSLFWTTGVEGDGLNAYSQEQMFAFFRNAFSLRANSSVIFSTGNDLAVSAGPGYVTVQPGAAIPYGVPYVSDANEQLSVPTPAGQTRIDRIVLRIDWTAHTVRVARLAGTEGGGAPALTQTPGTLYETPLASATINPAGQIAVSDERVYLAYSTVVTSDMILAGAITAAKIANGAVGTLQIADGSVTAAKLQGDALVSDVIYATVFEPGESLPIANDVARFYVAHIHNNAHVTQLWATLAAASTSGSVSLTLRDVTKSGVITTLVIPQGALSASAACSYAVSEYDLLRLDVTAAGTNALGLTTQITVTLT